MILEPLGCRFSRIFREFTESAIAQKIWESGNQNVSWDNFLPERKILLYNQEYSITRIFETNQEF